MGVFAPQTGQSALRLMRSFLNSMSEALKTSIRESSGGRKPVTSLIASIAIMQPSMPETAPSAG